MLQNAPFRSQIFQIFFASGGKGALTPLTKIPRTFLIRTVAATALCFQPLRPLLRAYGCACVKFSSYELTISSEYGAPPPKGHAEKNSYLVRTRSEMFSACPFGGSVSEWCGQLHFLAAQSWSAGTKSDIHVCLVRSVSLELTTAWHSQNRTH